ncbi:MAG: polysaccharide biosynthesis/export family protein [Caulobacteraceae bacterium]
MLAVSASLSRPFLGALLLLALAVPAYGQSSFIAPPPGAPFAAGARPDYRIGPLDKLDITVFEVKDLTIEKMQVDASGEILLPLIGAVRAQGRTTTELSGEIAARLAGRYMQNPQVSVVVEEAVSQKVSVEGAVNEAGVFEMKGRTSLLEAVAMAKGASKDANLHRVSIVRAVDGRQKAASFDLAAIRAGKAPNPEVFGNDVIIVDSSRSKLLWRGMIEAMPALIVFSYL